MATISTGFSALQLSNSTTALGAAYLAGLAAGYWSGLDEIAAQWQVERVFEPAVGCEQVDALRGDWARAVERSKGWAQAEAGPA